MFWAASSQSGSKLNNQYTTLLANRSFIVTYNEYLWLGNFIADFHLKGLFEIVKDFTTFTFTHFFMYLHKCKRFVRQFI